MYSPLSSLPGDTTYRLPSAPAENLALPVGISSPFYKHNKAYMFLYIFKGNKGIALFRRGRERKISARGKRFGKG